MAKTLQEAFETYKKARAEEAEKKAARVDADERARVAKDEHQASMTATENAKADLDNHIRMMSDPGYDPRR